MNYVKKMCILRQVKQGFSGDGKALSGLIKIEQYGKNLAAEVSIINFAPLVSGEYFCLLCDSHGVTEILPLRGKSLFNILSDMDIADGFCGVICYVKSEIVPIAYGVNGNRIYDWKQILNATMPPFFEKKRRFSEKAAVSENATENAMGNSADGNGEMTFEEEERETEVCPAAAEEVREKTDLERETEERSKYDDETLATENYYKREERNGQELFEEVDDDARAESTTQEQSEKTGLDASENGDADGVLHPFKTDSDGYYRAVKSEIDELMDSYPRDDSLKGAFSCSEWVRVKGEEGDPKYLVGVVYEEEKAKYVCYALAAENKNEPPEEIRNVCSFVPLSPFDTERGFFVIFQSAATGECIKPERA